MYDVIIIGGGPAGLSAAIYASRANKSVLVLEAVTAGGQILQTENIENYPGLPHIDGKTLAKNFKDQAKALGATIKTEKVLEINRPEPKTIRSKTIGTKHVELVLSRLESEKNTPRFEVVTDLENIYQSETIILATGTTHRKLHIEGEDELIGNGISFCATCDGTLFKNKEIAVYGGGNSALYSALYLSNITKKVYLIHRRDEFRADPALVEKIKNVDNIETKLNTKIQDFTSKNGKLRSINLTNGEHLDVPGLFVAIGREPADSELCENSDDISIDHNSDGYIIADENCETSEEGIFAAGDCREKDLRQIVTAVSDGAVAASNVIDFLNS